MMIKEFKDNYENNTLKGYTKTKLLRLQQQINEKYGTKLNSCLCGRQARENQIKIMYKIIKEND